MYKQMIKCYIYIRILQKGGKQLRKYNYDESKSLSELFKEDIRVIGASRTDSGVHAYCNVAVFDTPWDELKVKCKII